MPSRRPARFDGAFLDAVVFVETNNVLDRLSSGNQLSLAIRKGFRKNGRSAIRKTEGPSPQNGGILMLDVNQLSEKGCLRPGCSGTCQWIVGNELFSISLRAEAGRLHLSYTVRVGDGERRDMTETISIVHLPCRFGGNRTYFICPGPGDGTDCGRRVIKLHLSHRYFLCRHCNQLAYACQYERPWQRALSLTLANSEQAYRPCGMRNMGSLSTIS
jgi:hypothetical protein